MERVHQLLTERPSVGENAAFWAKYWYHIASAKVPLETKIDAYWGLRHRGVANINDLRVMLLYGVVLADRQFVARLDLDEGRRDCYRLIIMWINDDVVALTSYFQKMAKKGFLWNANEPYYSLRRDLQRVAMKINAPRCMRFLLQRQGFREGVMREIMSPLAQRLAEEFVQPTDNFDSWLLIMYGQSVKLIGMCVKDEELVAAWLPKTFTFTGCPPSDRGFMSVMLARKLHALATPDQRKEIRTKVMHTILDTAADDGYFELAWLLGLWKPSYRVIHERCRKNNVSLFPELTFAMIVAMCDGYLEVKQKVIMATQARFFMLLVRLPMDLQALVSLRLWGHVSTVIQRDKFDRALLAVI
jgi:hypothetical protein